MAVATGQPSGRKPYQGDAVNQFQEAREAKRFALGFVAAALLSAPFWFAVAMVVVAVSR